MCSHFSCLNPMHWTPSYLWPTRPLQIIMSLHVCLCGQQRCFEGECHPFSSHTEATFTLFEVLLLFVCHHPSKSSSLAPYYSMLFVSLRGLSVKTQQNTRHTVSSVELWELLSFMSDNLHWWWRSMWLRYVQGQSHVLKFCSCYV